MECGDLLKPKGKMILDTKAGGLSVEYMVCLGCGAEFVTVFRFMGAGNNYLGLVKIWPDTKKEAES